MSEKTKIRCPRCKIKFAISLLLLSGEQVECPKCKYRFAPPEPKDDPAPARIDSASIETVPWVESDRKIKEREKWISPPITHGGRGMMGAGVLIMLVGGLALLTLEPEYSYSVGRRIVDLTLILSALKRGFFFLTGILLFGFGVSQRMVRRDEK